MITVTPRGLRDVLAREAWERDVVTGRLRHAFFAWGYDRIETPVLERYATYESAAGDLEGTAFRLFDRDGELLALRPDMTVPIARMVSARLARDGRPHPPVLRRRRLSRARVAPRAGPAVLPGRGRAGGRERGVGGRGGRRPALRVALEGRPRRAHRRAGHRGCAEGAPHRRGRGRRARRERSRRRPQREPRGSRPALGGAGTGRRRAARSRAAAWRDRGASSAAASCWRRSRRTRSSIGLPRRGRCSRPPASPSGV